MELPSPRGTSRIGAWLAWAVGGSTFLHFWARTLADPDMWGHLEWGRLMLRTRSFFWIDTYSYTAAGEPFFDHEWLSDVVFAWVFDSAGSAGLFALKLGFGALMMAGILDAIRSTRVRLGPARPRPLLTAGALILSLAVIAPGATFRPQLVTMAFLAVEWALLERASLRLLGTGPRSVGWEVWAIPPLVMVWANAHGGFLVGIGLMGLFTGAACLRVLRTRRDLSGCRTIVALAAAGIATLAAPLLNPFGAELYTYLLRTLDDHGAISEWRPVPVWDLGFLRFKVLVLSIVGLAVACRRQLATWDGVWRLGFVLLAVGMAFEHQRHTVLVAIASAPLLATLGPRMIERLLARRPDFVLGAAARRMVAVGLLVMAGFQVGGVARSLWEDGTSIRFSRIDYPVDALSFLEQHGFEGNAAVPFDWGSYTAHRFNHRVKVFIDGRFEAVYPPQVISDYFAFANGEPGWQRLLDEYPTDIVVTQRALGTHEQMFGRKDFAYVYSDPAALVFVRRSPRTRAALDRLFGLASRPALPERDTVFP